MEGKPTLDAVLQSMDITPELRMFRANANLTHGMLVLARDMNVATVLQEARQGFEQDIAARVQDYVSTAGGAWQDLFPSYTFIPIGKDDVELGEYQRLIAFSTGNSGRIQAMFFQNAAATEIIVKDTGRNEGLILEARPGTYAAKGGERVYDITPEVEQFAADAGISKGAVFATSKHTTVSLLPARENTLLDHLVMMNRIAPFDAEYVHNDWSKRTNIQPDESKNGFSHVRNALTGNSVCIPVNGEKLQLNGSRVYLIDHDGPRQRRELTLSATRTEMTLLNPLTYTA